MWPPGSADTMYPPPACNDTGIAFCFPNEEEAEMRRIYIHTSQTIPRHGLHQDAHPDVHAFVMSRVDYCNAVFAVSPRYITDISMKLRNAQQVFC